ncbi:MAG TPA: flagellar hook-associated protein 3 [Gammaproteobacteria bacterium]|nr:flagellar hook-associated protein 3 [Gammaproteobacteria bacterium]
MRISSSLLSKIGLNTMLAQQKKLSDTQTQVATGRRILAPSDDPYGSARTLDLKEAVNLNKQYLANSAQIENRLGFEEGVLEGVENAMQRVRELTIQAANDSQTIETRRMIRDEIEQLLKQVIALSNTADANGEYIFSGYQGNTKPFESDGAGGFNYYGDDGQRFLKVGTSTTVAMGDSGAATFLDIKNGNGKFQTRDNPDNQGGGIIDPGTVNGIYVADNYRISFLPPNSGRFNEPVEYYVLDGNNNIIEPASQAGMSESDFIAGGFPAVVYEDGAVIQGLDKLGVNVNIQGTPTAEKGPPLRQDSFTISPSNNQSLFATVQNLIDTLGMQQQGTADLSEFHNAMNRNIVDLDQSIGKLLDVRSSIGARLNTLDKQIAINETFDLQLNTTLSEIQDLDYSEAVTRLNLQLVGLQAAQNAYTKVQGLSLFNFL